GNVNFWFGLVLVHELAKILQSDQLPGVVRDQMRRRGKMPVQQISNRIAAHPAALFEDAVIHPPLYLEKNRCINIVVVKTEPKFETVFIPIDGPPVKLQIVRVEVKAVDWIRVIRLAHPILVQLKIRAHELPDLESG